MAGKLQAELKQTKPFRLLEEEALLNIQRTADVLVQRASDVLREQGLSPTQYNVLRILRGAGSGGAICKEIGNRMVTRDPDITRLLDRLEKRKLIRRSRSEADRRQVTICITQDGLDVLKKLDQPIEELNRKILGHIDRGKLKDLIETLERIRC
jgi:DNA-binding MarR family transcriptional regulator